MTTIVAKEPMWVIAHGDVIHALELSEGSHVSTGQPHVEQFDNRQAWADRLDQLGYQWPEEDDGAEV